MNVQVVVRNGDLTKALRRFKKKCEQEGVITAMREHEFYRNPSTWRRLEQARAQARRRKLAKRA
jgi:small subunit ribosomal protein S21